MWLIRVLAYGQVGIFAGILPTINPYQLNLPLSTDIHNTGYLENKVAPFEAT
jgi:hypothetical protein